MMLLSHTFRPPAWMLLALSFLLCGCYHLRSSDGGGQTEPEPEREINLNDIALPDGYSIEIVTTGLAFPTSVTFDDEGTAYITEAGYSYGEEWTQPKLLRLDPDNKATTIVSGGKNGPWTGADYYEGKFYITEGGQLKGGKILVVNPQGDIIPLIQNLPSFGDHHTNSPVVWNGYIYFGQGTATNSAVVGNDNAEYGWLKRQHQFHDIPCEDITLRGINFETDNVLSEASGEIALTGAFLPYNTPSKQGQVIEGSLPCSGSIMRIPLEGGPPELVAWGFRNPFGLAYSPDGNLFVTDNGYDDRGSRPAWGTGDLVWKVQSGAWYGWPDFSGQGPLMDDDSFRPPGKEPVEPVLEEYPNKPPKPSAILGVHSSSNGIDFSSDPAFGFVNTAFIAQFGDMAPAVGKVVSPVGFKVVNVNVADGVVEDFAVNKGRKNGPATWLGKSGLERPIDVEFTPAGDELYIVDYGIMKMTKNGPEPQKETGVVFKVIRTEAPDE